MVDDLVKKARTALVNGNMGEAVAAKKALGHTIVKEGLAGDTNLMIDFHQIYDDIGRLHQQARKNSGQPSN